MAKYKIYFDDSGDAVGVGTEEIHDNRITHRVVERQTLRATAGSETKVFEEIDEPTFRDIQDPNHKLSLKDFKGKKSDPSH